ncbi:AEC family transporter [Candidatus Allofournierella merdipullorum]|uniref:AEC family transporter n=1 Tax=Candidatus Allofournierella merdipullorum TaxID=2838595 RepID=UPI002A8D2B86|nr:AEC family transporter [Candidatus Fournierella merdipullorum]
MAEVLQHSASYVFILALGYFLKRIGVFGKQDYRVLTQVVLCVTLPAAVITNFASMEWRSSLLLLPLLGFGICCAMMLLGQFIGRGKAPGERALFMINCPGYNIGAFALPFVQSYLGPEGVVAACLFDVGNAIICTGGSYAWASGVLHVGDKPLRPVDVLKKLGSSVPFVTYVTMLVLVMAGVQLPGALVEFISPISAANPFVAMLMIGAMFDLDLRPEYLRRVGQVVGIRLTAAVLLAAAMYIFVPLPLEIRQVLAVMAFAPASVISPAFTAKCGGDAGLTSCINSITILCGVVGMLVVLAVLGVA